MQAPSTPDLFVPVSFWNGPPSHSITHLLVSPDKTKIATSAKEGSIFLWNLNYYKEQLQENEQEKSNEPEVYYIIPQIKTNIIIVEPVTSKTDRQYRT